MYALSMSALARDGRSMNTSGQKTRFSIAAFQSRGDLHQAVTALLDAGFDLRQIGLAVTYETLEPACSEASGTNGHLPAEASSLTSSQANGQTPSEPKSHNAVGWLMSHLEPTATRLSAGTVWISANSLWQMVGCFSVSDEDTAEAANSGMPPGTRAAMLDHLERGAWLVGVNALSFNQLRAGMRILLAHSDARVETCELHLA